MKKKLLLTGLIGILGSLLMYAGDMLLYFSTDPIFDYRKILSTIPQQRLLLGGLLGPLSAFFYFIGFYHLSLAIKPIYSKRRIAFWGSLCLSMTFGAAYHSHFSHLGYMASLNFQQGFDLIYNNISYYFIGVFVPMLIASLIMIEAILSNKTYYPKWMICFMPGILIFVGEPFKHLPQPYYVLISGGWYNLMYILLLSVSITVLINKKE